MPITLSPPGNVRDGSTACFTVSGVTAGPPEVSVLIDGVPQTPTLDPVGAGTYVVCFYVPQGARTVGIDAADGTGGTGGSDTMTAGVTRP